MTVDRSELFLLESIDRRYVGGVVNPLVDSAAPEEDPLCEVGS